MKTNQIIIILKYLKYYFTSSTKHDIHSPFVFELLTTVIKSKTKHKLFESIEKTRKELLCSNEEIEIADFGAGGLNENIKKKKVNCIAANSLKSLKYSELLFRLANYFKPQNILELGTSFGISTMYMALSNAKVTTIEGCKNISEIAEKNFETCGLKNINIITGNFDSVLPEFIEKADNLDFVFFDGNHRKEPTINYFETCLRKVDNNSVFIFDDIHWSQEMEEAWEYIKKSDKVTVTIDLFFLGLVFFRKEQAKQNFVIRL